MRLALAPLNATVGDPEGNVERARRAIDAARDVDADLVVLPELWISGYPPRDLLFQQGFIEACTRAARRLGEEHTRGIAVAFGCPLPAETRHGSTPALHNSALVFEDGRRLGFYDKRLLPTYDVFDEDRYFIPGNSPVVVEIAGTRVGLAICEDLWKGEDAGFADRYRSLPDPVADLARAGAQVLVVPSASPFVLGKGRRHMEIFREHAARHAVALAGVNQSGGNDELIFDGHAVVFDHRARLIAAGHPFAQGLVVADLGAPAAEVADPFEHAEPEALVFGALVTGVRDYVRKTGFTSAILGLSGGIDSAVAACIACAALGPANVLGVSMPGPYSSDHSREDAAELARRLGCEFVLLPIDAPIDAFRAALDPVFHTLGRQRLGASLPDLAEENLQSRARGTLLMALSNRTGAMVLSTGNKSELSVGYCTLYGDMNGGLAVLSDLTKAWVYRLARWINAPHPDAGFTFPPIPDRSISKPPSAELRPGQTDQDSLPAYDILDAIVERYVERRQSPERIAEDGGFEPAIVRHVVRLIDSAEHKRKQLSTGLKVTSVAFGAGRRIPIARGR